MNITLKALEQLRLILKNDASATGLRVSLQPTCCEPRVEFTACNAKQPDEKIISVDGIDIYLDAATDQYLSGTLVDHNANGFKAGFMGQEGRCCK